MEDKTFELIEKMYDEFSKKFEGIDKKFDGLEGEVRKTNVLIEHDIIPKITVLFDGHKQHTA